MTRSPVAATVGATVVGAVVALALAGCAPQDAVPTKAPTGADRATPTEQSSPRTSQDHQHVTAIGR